MDQKYIETDKSFQTLLQENQELKDLIFKLNQDKTMYEKKVSRRNSEILRLKQQLKGYEDSANKGITKSISITSLSLQEDKVSVQSQTHQEVNVTQMNEKISETCSPTSQKKQKNLENEITRLHDQIKLDTNYFNKRNFQLEESFLKTQNNLQDYLQVCQNDLQIQTAKVVYLMSRISVYEKAISEIHGASFELREQILHQYVTLKQNYKNLKMTQQPNEKVEELVKQNDFLKHQLIKIERDMREVEDLACALEKLSIIKYKVK